MPIADEHKPVESKLNAAIAEDLIARFERIEKRLDELEEQMRGPR